MNNFKQHFPICFLDVDGVLTDFDSHMSQAHGGYAWYGEGKQPWNITEWLGISEENWWKPADNAAFWEDMPWTEDGGLILRLVENFFDQKNVCLLTSPSRSPHATAGKIAWIQRELPRYAKQFLVGSTKHFCASRRAVLIDDNDTNIENFTQAGGRGILIARRWNNLYEVAEDTIPQLEHNLHQLGIAYQTSSSLQW